MIHSLTELDEAIKKGQQFEVYSDATQWVRADKNTLSVMYFGSVTRLIRIGALRVRQIKQ